MQAEPHVQPLESIPQSLEEMVEQCVNLLTSHVTELRVACHQSGAPQSGDQLWAEYCRWVNETLIPALRKEWKELEALWDKVRPFLVRLEQDPMGTLADHWDVVKGYVDGFQRQGYMPSNISVEDLITALLLKPEPRMIPPGHSTLGALGINNEGQWNSLTPAQQQLLYAGMMADTGRRQTFVRKGSRLVTNWASEETRNSVSDERVVGDVQDLDVGDPSSTRFMQHLDAEDELDRLLARVHLSPSERIIAEGMRRDYTGQELVTYVLQQPEGQRLSQKSIPVLASKVRSKLRAAAKQ